MVKINIILEGEVNDTIQTLQKLLGTAVNNKRNDLKKVSSLNKSNIQNYDNIKETKQKVVQPKTQWTRKFVQQVIDSNKETNTLIYNEINSAVNIGISVDELTKKLNIPPITAYQFLGSQTKIINKINKINKTNLQPPVNYNKEEKIFHINKLFSDYYHSLSTKPTKNNTPTQITTDTTHYSRWDVSTIRELISSLNITNQIILHELQSAPNHSMTIDNICKSLSINPKVCASLRTAIKVITKRLNRERNITLYPVCEYDTENKVITMSQEFAEKFR